MPIHAGNKGKGGEQEVAAKLNLLINTELYKRGMPFPDVPQVQRNQNQSAVGGKDLVGTYNLAIEVKRQEALSVNTWWDQCVKSAEQLGETPVLIFRQNKQKWRVITHVRVPITEFESLAVRAELTFEQFEAWFTRLAQLAIDTNARAAGTIGGGEALFS